MIIYGHVMMLPLRIVDSVVQKHEVRYTKWSCSQPVHAVCVRRRFIENEQKTVVNRRTVYNIHNIRPIRNEVIIRVPVIRPEAVDKLSYKINLMNGSRSVYDELSQPTYITRKTINHCYSNLSK